MRKNGYEICILVFLVGRVGGRGGGGQKKGFIGMGMWHYFYFFLPGKKRLS